MTLTGARQDAEDLVQATCVRALERAGQYEEGTHLDRWLIVMMRRIWINELRRKAVQRRQGFLVKQDVQQFVDGNAIVEGTIYLSEVLKEINDLPEAQREAMLLVYGEEYSYRDAAKLLEIPEGTLMSRLARARVSLKSQFEVDNSAQTNLSQNRQVKNNAKT